MDKKAFERGGKSKQQTKLKQVLKFEAEMQDCLTTQLEQTTKIQTLVEGKKKRI